MLSSADRQATEDINRFSIVFPENLMRVQPNELLRIQMTYFSLLNSFQNINANNNRVGVVLVQGTSTYSGFITLPNGSYSVNVIATNMTTALNNLFGSYTTFTMTCPDTTTYYSKLVWTTAITSLTFYFTNVSLPASIFTQQQRSIPMNNGMSRLLGYAQGTASAIYTSSGTLSPYNMFSGQIPFLRLHVDVPPQNVEYDTSLGNNQMNYSDILSQIPILVPPFAPIIYQDFTGDANCYEMPSKGMRIGTMNFTLTDNYNTLAIANDDFFFTLKIEVLVDEGNDTKNILQDTLNTLKLQTLNMENYFGEKNN